jgi:Rrf2 family protein
MLSLSRTTGSAILAFSCLEGPEGTPISEEKVAQCRGISKSYLSKIILKLAKKGLVKTKRGARGGLLLTKEPEQVSFLEIAEAIEGSSCIGPCLLGIEEYSEFCPIFPFWEEERKRIEHELRSKNLLDVRKSKTCE